MASDPTILAFDTSAAHCAALLLCGGETLAEVREDMDKGQAERLFPLMSELLSTGGMDWHELDGIGVCTGPGNFTGVRIGVSAARGLSLSLGIPAIGISMLEALAFGQKGASISILDARRERYFTQEFQDGTASANPEIQPIEALNLADNQINCVTPLGLKSAACHIPQNPLNAIAHITVTRLGVDNPRPAPLYLRAPNAALPTEQPPIILS